MNALGIIEADGQRAVENLSAVIAAAQGGSIRAENRTGPDGAVEGARFVVTLPEARR